MDNLKGLAFFSFYMGLTLAFASWVHEMYVTENFIGFVIGMFLPPVSVIWGIVDLFTTPFS